MDTRPHTSNEATEEDGASSQFSEVVDTPARVKRSKRGALEQLTVEILAKKAKSADFDNCWTSTIGLIDRMNVLPPTLEATMVTRLRGMKEERDDFVRASAYYEIRARSEEKRTRQLRMGTRTLDWTVKVNRKELLN